MADTKISEMTAAVTAADADLVPIVQGGVNKKATVDLILDALTAARVATAIGSTAANLVYAGPASGASAVPAARSLVADDIPASLPLSKLAALTIDRALISSGAGVVAVSSVTATELGYVSGVTSAIQTQLGNKQPLDATLTALAALDGTVGFVRQTAADTFERTTDGSTLTGLNATNLASGTIPDDRFPAVLPAISGANLTNLPGGISGLTAGVIPVATSGTAIGNSTLVVSGNVISQVNGASAQTYRLYRVADEWLEIKADNAAAQFAIQTAISGGGTQRGIDITATGGAGLTLQGAGDDGVRLTTAGVAHRWQVPTATGHFVPVLDDTYDIGTAAARVKDVHAYSLKTAGRSYLAVPASAPTDGDIANGAFSAYLDEAGNALKIRVRYSDGTLKLATIALA